MHNVRAAVVWRVCTVWPKWLQMELPLYSVYLSPLIQGLVKKKISAVHTINRRLRIKMHDFHFAGVDAVVAPAADQPGLKRKMLPRL